MRLYTILSTFYHNLLNRKKERYLATLVRQGLTLGREVQIIDAFFFDPSHCFLISIGDYCTICPNVRLIAHDASTKRFLGYTKIGRVDIRERSFIGDSVIVLPNVTIGPEAIVGAGSVVNQDVPPRMVAAGNPARVIAPLDEYLAKMRALESSRGVFGEDYHIHRLDTAKRREILAAVSDSLALIV